MKLSVKVLDQLVTDHFALYQGDCAEVLCGIADASVHFSIYSPPFASLYTYSASPRDLGNCATHDEFFDHFSFLLPEMLRVTKPGRNMSVHCMDLPTSKTRDGEIGLTDFPGQLIRKAKEAGWIWHSKVTIWKDPVTAMQRTKALGLLWKQILKDSCMSRMGIPDYVLTFRKPGENPERVSHTKEEFPVDQWQKWASPIWDDINPSDTLQYRSARENEDERHICLAAGAMVLTRAHGFLEIEEVEPGDLVLTHRGRWKQVVSKHCNGIAETVRIRGQGVADLTLTREHRLWARRGSGPHAKAMAREADPCWMQAIDTLGSYINLPLPPEETSALSDHEWWIVGRWLGDGCRGGHRRSGKRGGLGQFYISCAHNESAALIERLGVHAGHAASGTATQVALIDLRDEVRDVLDRCGDGAENKRLPGEALTLPPGASESLLAGYLSADGHYVEQYDRVCASSVSRALLLGMAMLAQRARGVVASVYAGRQERYGEIMGRRVHMLQDWIFSFRNSDGYRKSGWIDDHGAWKKVRSIDDAGQREVWDLQVADDESFVAEGCVVHNCPLQLEVSRRCIRLWSNPGDIVLSPFAGIGSEGFVALEEGRRFVGVELKRSYYEQAACNLASAEPNAKGSQVSLFSRSAS